MITIDRVHSVAFHRNGIGGAPFHAVVFEDAGPEGSRKLAILFEEPCHIAVLDIRKLGQGNIAFGQNSWRGDLYEPALRRAIHRFLNDDNSIPTINPEQQGE